ncbi:MAG TPA: hypothetical protein GX518_01705 [Firmicutes bacterium]|nr:hypothetical protein [Bacillota bacterium]
MLDLLLLPLHLAVALLGFIGGIILFPLRLAFKLTLGFVAFLGGLFLLGGILLALFLVSLVPGIILGLLGIGILLTLRRR